MYHRHVVSKQVFQKVDKARAIPIIRHPKIRGDANPYAPEDEAYFEQRINNHMLNKLAGKRTLRQLYTRQNGCCMVCGQRITSDTGWDTHHLIPKHLGGEWTIANLAMLHPVCHVQVHQNDSVAAALTITCPDFTSGSVSSA